VSATFFILSGSSFGCLLKASFHVECIVTSVSFLWAAEYIEQNNRTQGESW